MSFSSFSSSSFFALLLLAALGFALGPDFATAVVLDFFCTLGLDFAFALALPLAAGLLSAFDGLGGVWGALAVDLGVAVAADLGVAACVAFSDAFLSGVFGGSGAIKAPPVSATASCVGDADMAGLFICKRCETKSSHRR